MKETIVSFGGLERAPVLDVGCGDGDMTQKLFSESRWMAGVDPDPTCIRDAIGAHAHPNLTFAVASAESLCFSDGSFQSVIFNQSFHHVPHATGSKAARIKPATVQFL